MTLLNFFKLFFPVSPAASKLYVMFYLIRHARYWSSVQTAISHQNWFSWRLDVDGPFLKFTRCPGSWGENEQLTYPETLSTIKKKKKDTPRPQPMWCNLLVSFKCFGAIRGCVKILQTFPKKQAHQHFKFILAWIPTMSKNLRVTEAITCEFLSSSFTCLGAASPPISL